MKEPTTEEVIDVLQKAREVIQDDRFWAKGSFCVRGEGGPVAVCALGAIAMVMPRERPLATYAEGSPEVKVYAQYLTPGRDPTHAVPMTNDHFGRAETIKLFDGAIDTLSRTLVVEPVDGAVKPKEADSTIAEEAAIALRTK